MSQRAKDYITHKEGQAIARQPKAKKRLEKLIPDANGKVEITHHDYHLGGGAGADKERGEEDIESILGHLEECAVPPKIDGLSRIVGLCKSVDDPDDWVPQYQYNFPAEVVEVTRVRGLSAYYPRAFNEPQIKKGMEVEEEIIDTILKSNFGTSYKAAKIQLEKKFPEIQLKELDESKLTVDKTQLKKVTEALPWEDRLRYPGASSGIAYKEFHVLPSYATVILKKAFFEYALYENPWWPIPACHDLPDWDQEPFFSEWSFPKSSSQPGGMTPLMATRVITNAVKLTGDRNYAENIAKMVKNPLGCAQDNTDLQLELKKIFPGLVIQKQDNGEGGCYQEKKMYGRTVAPTNRMADFYETSSALTASVRGMFLAYDMFPERFYDFDINKDLIQWTRPDSMPKQCMKVGDGPISPQMYNAANLDEEEHGGSSHDFHTLIHWRTDFSCCLPGYFPTNQKAVKKK